MNYSVKAIRKQFAAHGVFYTDLKLAELLRDIVSRHGPVVDVYDPTCGGGNLLSVFPDDVAKFGQELNPEQADEARRRLANATIIAGDTLTDPAFVDRKFKHIVANYPFSVRWEQNEDARWADAPVLPPPAKADYAFIMHILYMLADDGIAAVLGFPGILYRGQREGKIRQWIIEQNLIESVTLIERGYFEDTDVSTALVVFRKDKTTSDIRFADHETGREIVATIEQVRQNNFNLSPTQYLPYENDRIEIDPVEKEIEARNRVLHHLAFQLKFSSAAMALHEMPGLPPLPPISDFIKDIRLILSEYE